MEQPRLKIDDQEVGLRNLGNGLFEPKNFEVFINPCVNYDCTKPNIDLTPTDTQPK